MRMFRTFDDCSVVVIVSEVPCGSRVYVLSASPAANEASFYLGLPCSALCPELGIVPALFFGSSCFVCLAVVFGAVLAVGYADAVGLGAVASTCHAHHPRCCYPRQLSGSDAGGGEAVQ